jgi:hypothetical protein
VGIFQGSWAVPFYRPYHRAMAERPKSLLIPFMAAAVVAGLARMVIEKIKRDRQARAK